MAGEEFGAKEVSSGLGVGRLAVPRGFLVPL